MNIILQAIHFVVVIIAVWVELTWLGREVYFSDAEYYFRAGFLSDEQCSEFAASFYVCFLRILGAAHIELWMLCLVVGVIYTIGVIMALNHKKSDVDVQFLAVFFFHPFIAFLIARGMKEILYIFPALLLFTYAATSRRRNALLLFGTLGLLGVSALIRPYGDYFFFAVIGAALIHLASWGKILPMVIVVLITLAELYLSELQGVQSNVVAGLKDHQQNFGDAEKSLAAIPSFVTFLIGPTPIRPLMDVLGFFSYEFGTVVTLYILFVGSIYSLVCVWRVIKLWVVYVPTLDFFGRLLFWNAVSLIAIYSIIYGGSVDTRHRGLFFLLLGIMLLIHTLHLRRRHNEYGLG